MQRLTRLASHNEYYVTDCVTGILDDEGYYGEAVEKLAQFENLYDHLIARQQAIPKELEALRVAGKEKTVKFKELLAQKLINENFLTLLTAQKTL